MPAPRSHPHIIHPPQEPDTGGRVQANVSLPSPTAAARPQSFLHSSPALPRKPPPLSQTTETSLHPPEHLANEYFPASPGSTVSYSGKASFAEKHPVHVPSPTYSQSSHAEQGILGRDIHSRSEILDRDPYRNTSAGGSPNVHMSSGYVYQTQSEDDADDERMSDHAVWLLAWLAFLLPAFSFFSALYSCITILVVALVSPCHFCGITRSFPANIERLLSPLWRAQLKALHSERLQENFVPRARPAMLVIFHLGSPLLSIGVALAAWLAAAFWLFAAIMGNPDGTERGDDGRNTVVIVRNWWHTWLLKSEREE